MWMFHSRRVKNKINHLRERSLRIVYKENYSSYVDLLVKDKSFTIHQQSIFLLNNLQLRELYQMR